MSAVVEVSIAVDQWRASCPGATALAEKAALAALESGAAESPAIVGVVLTGDAEQRELNRIYRGKDAPTNVLAFALAEAGERSRSTGAPLLLGDVVLAFETVAREAEEQQKPFADHLRHLVVHGVLHLLGFDHETEEEAARMEARETEILAALGVPDPYRTTM